MKIPAAFLICATVLFGAACHINDPAVIQQVKKDSSYAIIGKVTGQDSGIIYLIHRQTGKTDSAFLDHGFFKFNGKADTAEFCRINLNDHQKSFFLENGKISMLIEKDSMKQAQITGTKLQDEFNYFQNQLSNHDEKMTELEDAMMPETRTKSN
jgi:hypothetical protein